MWVRCISSMQVNEKDHRELVAYISRSMTETERYYAQIEKEALSLTWAAEKFAESTTSCHWYKIYI